MNDINNLSNLKSSSEITCFLFLLLSLNIVFLIYNSYCQAEYYFTSKNNNILRSTSKNNKNYEINIKDLLNEEVNIKSLCNTEKNIIIKEKDILEDSNHILTSDTKHLYNEIDNLVIDQISFGQYQTYEENNIENDILNNNDLLSEMLSIDDLNNVPKMKLNSEVDFADFENNIIFNYTETLKNNKDNHLKSEISKKEKNFILPFDIDNNIEEGIMKEREKEDYYDPNDDFIVINKDNLNCL